MSLEDAIAQQINLGQRDPLTIADKCANLYGGDWVAEQLAANWRGDSCGDRAAEARE